MKTHIRFMLSGVAVFGLSACVAMIDPTLDAGRMLFDDIDSEQLAKATKARDDARGGYEGLLARHQEAIAQEKAGVQAELEARDLAGALGHLTRLYELTHPCGEEDCGTHPCPEGEDCGYGYEYTHAEVFMEREGLDPEVAALEAGVEGVWALIDAYAEARRFDEADVALARHIGGVPFESRNMDRFAKRHAEVKDAWIATLEQDARIARKRRAHGESALLFAKAASLARQLGSAEVVARNQRDALAQRDAAIAARGYTVSVSGTDELVKVIQARDYTPRIRYVDGGALAKVTVREGLPSYSRRTVRTSGSFEYVSGTREVSNPAWTSQNRECELATSSYESTKWSCENNGPKNAYCQPGDLSEDRDEMNQECDALSSLEKTTTEDVYSTESYPITRRFLTTTLPIDMSLRHEDGRKGARQGKSVAELFDDEHSAHSRNGSGVGAAPASPRTEPEGYEAAFGKANGEVIAHIQASFAGYRRAMIEGARGKDEVEDLATAVLIASHDVPGDLAKKLSGAAEITDASELLIALSKTK